MTGRDMRILATVPHLSQPGGVASYYSTLYSYLKSDMDYLAVGARAVDERLVQKPFGFLHDCWTFFKRLRGGQYDAVLVNPTFGRYAIIREAAFILMAKGHKKKTLVYIRGWRWDAIKRRCVRWLLRQIYFRADAIIVQGVEFKRALERIGCKKPIYVETTVLSEEAFSYAPKFAATSADAVSACCRILFLSRIEKEKGVYEAINAFRKLKQKHPSVMLTIAGTGAEVENVKQYVAKQQITNISFTGWLVGQAKRCVYEQSDIFLFPSSWGEGMPNAVLDAMAYGLPLVTRSVGAIPDLFAIGQVGFMTESRNPADFADLMAKVIENADLRSKLARENRALALKYFAPLRVADRLRAIHRNVLFGEECPQEWFSNL
ncbi:MAG: glycosyltransferase [Phycisphaerae bacterium]|nr:glycosyltransferase [Phycisphaerae bacterium]